jgi:DNA-directed RNA polymerase specialized sigma24 family protein
MRAKTSLSRSNPAAIFKMSYQEIANKIEEPLSNVKIKLLRAKNYWQKLFEINANSPLR